MKQIQLAYLAGLFDGEGSFSIQVRVREYKGKKSVLVNPRMTMSIRYGDSVLKEMQDAFGGQIYDYSKTDGMFRWNLSKRKPLLFAARQLMPHLRIKKLIASRFIEALNVCPNKRANHLAGERTWTPEMVTQIAHIALTLNPPKSRKSRHLPAYGNAMRKLIYE